MICSMQRKLHVNLLLYSTLVGARDAHIFPVLRDGTASHLNSLRLQDAGDLLVGQRTAWIFFFDKFFHAAFEDEQRGVAALRALARSR